MTAAVAGSPPCHALISMVQTIGHTIAVATDLPPGNYELIICISGTISLPCQSAGAIPFQGIAQLEAAITSALDQWLAATAGTPDCTRGATTSSGFDGVRFTATATATCGDASSTVTITIRHL